MSVKFLIIGDLHGNRPKIYFKNFDAIIAPGDFCSDKYERELWNKYMKSEWSKPAEKRLSFEKFVKEKLGINKSQLKEFSKKSLGVGREILEYLNSFNKPVFIIPGNWDQSYPIDENKEKKSAKAEIIRRHVLFSGKNTNQKLIRGLKNVKDCQFNSFNFKGYNLLGYGLNQIPELPEKRKFMYKTGKKRFSEKDWAQVKASYRNLFNQLKKVYLKASKKTPLIFLSHNMPYNTKFDKIIKPGTPVHGKHYGSKIARDFILKYRPLVCVGGHMHEYFGKIKLGKTIVINGGFGSKVNTLLELEENKIKSLKFYGAKISR